MSIAARSNPRAAQCGIVAHRVGVPEERYVYSSTTHPIPALQRSAMWYCRTVKRDWMRRGWVPQPAGLGNQAPTMDAVPPILLYLAPEERHVPFV